MKYNKGYLLSILCIAALLSFAGNAVPSFAAKAGDDRYLSRGEMAVMMSATDFMKEKIGNLLSFAVGYNLTSLNRMTMAPIIRFTRVNPDKVPPDGRTPFNLYVSVDDPGGLSEIIGVRADISNLGKYSNMSLVDNGLWGDEKANDGIYTLQTNTSSKIRPGEKEVSVSVVNKKGWLSVAKTNLTVANIPTILNVGVFPHSMRPDGSASVKMFARVSDPGGTENIARVSIDMSAIGGPGDATMRSEGSGDDMAGQQNLYSTQYIPERELTPGAKKLTVRAVNRTGGSSSAIIVINIVK